MFFRNLTFFRFPAIRGGLFQTPMADDLDQLHVALAECALKPVGAMELASVGFLPPLGRPRAGEDFGYTLRVGNACLVTLASEEKVLPASVVNEELRKRAAKFEELEGRSPGGRTRKRMKEDVVQELLPKAFIKPGRLDGYFDFDRGVIAVDTASRKRAEMMVSNIRNAAGTFPALPLSAEVAPRTVLTGWLAGDVLPAGFSLGNDCELRDPSDRGAVVKVQHLELQGEEVQQHLSAGMQCTRLALVWQAHMSFVIGEDLVLRKVKFLDGVIDSLESTEREDLAAEVNARFALMAGTVGEVFDALASALKLTVADPDEPAPKRTANRVQRAAKRLDDMAREQGITMEVIHDGQSILTFGAEQPA